MNLLYIPTDATSRQEMLRLAVHNVTTEPGHADAVKSISNATTTGPPERFTQLDTQPTSS